MANITDFQQWLDSVNLKGEEDAYNLYDSIVNFEQSGIFYTHKEVTNDGYQYFVSADGVLDKLFIDSDNTKFDFLNYLAKNYTDAKEGDVQKWYTLKKELGRTD